MRNPDNLRPTHPDQTVILLVEDEVIVQNVARIVLEREGYFVLAAGDGEEALVISRQYSGPIHLCLTDVKMPRMDGLQLRQHMIRERPNTSVLLMSGQVGAQDIDATPLLPEPFVPATLREAVRNVLASPVLFPPG